MHCVALHENAWSAACIRIEIEIVIATVKDTVTRDKYWRASETWTLTKDDDRICSPTGLLTGSRRRWNS